MGIEIDALFGHAKNDAELLTSVGLSPKSRLLDFGSGPGRLAIGLIESGWTRSYLGVELKERSVRWASAEITSRFSDFQFVGVDAHNARYNPEGSESPRLPVDDGSVDFVCAFSVFSHMLSHDTTTYLKEIRRALTPNGFAFITAFVATGVPDETENPEWLGEWAGRLHCVLYSRSYFLELISDSGMTFDRDVDWGGARQADLLLRAGQGGLLLRPA
jgi:cyclopropane fatty-acyl-phospholipid synthase-like methyltransferase